MSEETPQTAPAPRPRRRYLRPLAALLAGLLALPLVAAALILWMASDTVLELPQGLQTRIEARLDEAMQANRISVGGMGVALRDGGHRPQIVLTDVEMRDAGGLRALFPEVSVILDGRALMRGEVRPARVAVGGAGLLLRRDAEGRIDLALATGEEAEARDVTESLARIDQMFAQPVFDRLEEVTGSDLELTLVDALTGQDMRVFGAEMRLVRKGAALTLTVGGNLQGSRDGALSLAVTRNASLARTDMRMQFQNLSARDLATATPALAWLDLMRAPISGALTTQLQDDGTVGDLSGTLDIGQGRISLGEGIEPLPFSAMRAYFDFDADVQRLSFSELLLDAPALSFAAVGHADLMPDGTSYVGQFQFTGIEAAPDDLFDAPVEIEGGAADIRLSLAPNVRLEIGQAVLFNGPLHVRAEGEIAAEPEGLAIRVDAHIPEVAAETVLPYWPGAAIPNTRRWLEDNLAAGQLRNVSFAIRADPGAAPRHALRLDFGDAELRAVRDMPPIVGGAGYLSLIGTRLALMLDAGGMAAPSGNLVSLAGSTLVIEDTRMRGPDAVIELSVAGALPDVLGLLEGPPVNLFSDSPIAAATLATGRVRATGVLGLRLMRGVQPEDVALDLSGQVTGVRSDTLVAGRVLSARRLDVALSSRRITVAGRAELDGVPLTGSWSRALGPDAPRTSRVEGSGPLSRDTLAAFGVALPNGFVSGQGRAEFALDLVPDTAPRLIVTSDLSGVALALPALGWRKGTGQTGALRAEVLLGETPSVPVLELDAAGLDLAGAATLREGGGLGRMTANRFRLGGWMDVTGALVGRGAGRAPSVEVTGGTIDLRRAPSDGPDGGGSGGPITLALDRLQVSQGIALTALRAELTTTGGLSGQFRGNVNGAAPVAGTLISTEAGPAIRLRADDGGAVLRAAGVLQNAHGGDMQLILRATGAPGTYAGQLDIAGPRLRNAPAMAELLNLISVVGLLEQLGGEGINLGDVEARFRLTPNAIVIDEGTAVGPSMGISMDGVYDIANRRMDMQGVVSPFYVVNGLFGALFAPRREGLFGFSYRLTGSPEDTNVSVNPLSILTPGIFRDIFRRPPPQVTQ